VDSPADFVASPLRGRSREGAAVRSNQCPYEDGTTAATPRKRLRKEEDTMTTKTRPSKANALARDQRVSAALAKHFTRSATINLAGKSHKVSELHQLLADRSDAVATVNALKDELKTAVAAANAQNDAASAMIIALRLHVLSEYGPSSQVAADFAFDTKRTSPTAETTARAVARRAAIRSAKKAALAEAVAKLGGTTPPSATVTLQKPTNAG
jgi:hypothetical protein